MGLPDAIKDLQMQTMNFVHRSLLTVSGGRIGRAMGNVPVSKVTTTGRTSGQPRTVMLTAPVRDGDTFVFVASKGGDDRDPDWYRNMVANPEFTIEPTDGSSPTTLVARTASAEEKAELGHGSSRPTRATAGISARPTGTSPSWWLSRRRVDTGAGHSRPATGTWLGPARTIEACDHVIVPAVGSNRHPRSAGRGHCGPDA